MLGLIGKRKATPVLGLDISSTTVKLLELSYSGDRYRVESYAVSSLAQDAVIEKNVNDVEAVTNAVRSVVAAAIYKELHAFSCFTTDAIPNRAPIASAAVLTESSPR